MIETTSYLQVLCIRLLQTPMVKILTWQGFPATFLSLQSSNKKLQITKTSHLRLFYRFYDIIVNLLGYN